MAAITNPGLVFLVITTLAIIVGISSADCGIEGISVSQNWTGLCVDVNGTYRSPEQSCDVGEKEVMLVTVDNNCNCDLKNIVLNCPGFQDTAVEGPISWQDDRCLVLDPIPSKSLILFSYAGSVNVSFSPLGVDRCAECGIEGISITQDWTGLCVHGHGNETYQPPGKSCDDVEEEVMLVRVDNNRNCDLKNLVLNCPGFREATPVGPIVMAPSGSDRCLFLDPLPSNSFIILSYANSVHLSFSPLGVDCC